MESSRDTRQHIRSQDPDGDRQRSPNQTGLPRTQRVSTLNAQNYWCHDCQTVFPHNPGIELEGKCGCGSQFIEVINPDDDAREFALRSRAATVNSTDTENLMQERGDLFSSQTVVWHITLEARESNSRRSDPIQPNAQNRQRAEHYGLPESLRINSEVNLRHLGLQTSPSDESQGISWHRVPFQPRNDSGALGLVPVGADGTNLEENFQATQVESELFPAESEASYSRFQGGFRLLMDLGRRMAEAEPGL